jgi:Ca2+-binding EF-hand superfamily protein
MGNKQGKKSSKLVLSEKDLIVLLDNTNFTREQILDWHLGFLVCHIFLFLNIFTHFLLFYKTDCPSGQLSKKKFIEVYKQFYPNGKAEKFCEHVFRTFDRDSNGYIGINIFISEFEFSDKSIEFLFYY